MRHEQRPEAPSGGVRVEAPAGCPMRGEVYPDGGVHFTMGSTVDAMDNPVEVVFEPGALRRYVALANEVPATFGRRGTEPVTVDTAADVDELDALLEQLGKRGFLLHRLRDDRHGPEVLAGVLDVGGIADVLILHTKDYAVAACSAHVRIDRRPFFERS